MVAGFDLVDPFPEVTSILGWTPPMTLQVLSMSELAPKEEEVIYQQRAQLDRWRVGEWKERGTGDVMLLKHKKHGSVRFLMWQEKTFKTVAKFSIVESSSYCRLRLHDSDRKTWAWEWSCQDHSDDCINEERLALHLETEELANEFKQAFQLASLAVPNTEGTYDDLHVPSPREARGTGATFLTTGAHEARLDPVDIAVPDSSDDELSAGLLVKPVAALQL